MRKFGRTMAFLLTAVLMSASCVVPGLAATTKTRLETVAEAYWDEDDITIGLWEEVEHAYQYEVYLYCEESKVDSFKTKKTKFNMSKKMTAEGEYTFKVRALAQDGSKKYSDGYWSDESDSVYISASYAELMENGGVIDTNTTGPGANEGAQPTKSTSVVYTPQWIQENELWRYRQADGSFITNAWWQDSASMIWYFFNDQGYMATGWIDWNGAKYYCLPSGAMVTGDQTIDGAGYHFDANGALQP